MCSFLFRLGAYYWTVLVKYPQELKKKTKKLSSPPPFNKQAHIAQHEHCKVHTQHKNYNPWVRDKPLHTPAHFTWPVVIASIYIFFSTTLKPQHKFHWSVLSTQELQAKHHKQIEEPFGIRLKIVCPSCFYSSPVIYSHHVVWLCSFINCHIHLSPSSGSVNPSSMWVTLLPSGHVHHCED